MQRIAKYQDLQIYLPDNYFSALNLLSQFGTLYDKKINSTFEIST